MLEILSLSSVKWSELFLALKLFLWPVGKSGEGQLDFFHRQVAKAVRNRYLVTPAARQQYHSMLAKYFMKKCDPNGNKQWLDYSRGTSELPFHLMEVDTGYPYEER